MSVNHKLIALARESRGISQKELSRQLSVSQGKISKIESGLIPTNDEELGRIATVLRYPRDRFYLDDTVYGAPIAELFHRKRASVSQRLLTKIYAQIELRRMELTRLLKSIEYPEISFPRLDPDEFDGDVERIAQTVRTIWRIPKGAIANVTDIIEDAGGIVFEFDFETDKIDAISMWTPGMPPIFFVNPNAPTDRLRYTLCHEIGHIIMHSIPSPTMEDEANKFAAEFLMPAYEIRSRLRGVRLPDLAALKKYWKVSMQALLFRAGELNCIDFHQKDYLWRQFSRLGYRTKEPVELSVPKEPPKLLKELILVYTQELKYSFNEIAQIIGLFEREASSLYHPGQSHLHLVK